MLLLLPAVYRGCIRTVIVPWLRRARGLCVLLRLSGVRASARWSRPISPLPTPSEHVVQPRRCREVLLGAALGCPTPLPSVGVSLLKWKGANNLVSESVFRSLLPSSGAGGDVSTTARAISSPQAQHSGAQVLAKTSLDGAGGAGNHWGLLAFMETQHVSLFKLCAKAFLQERSKV